MNNKQVKVGSLEEWTDKLAEGFSTELFKMIAEKTKNTSDSENLSRVIIAKFVARLVEEIVIRTLQERPDYIKSNKEMMTYNTRSFADLKLNLQEAIAFGFTQAMTFYTGKNYEYYCLVKPVPEPQSKKVC